MKRRQTQVPFGNDNQKGNGKYRGNSEEQTQIPFGNDNKRALLKVYTIGFTKKTAKTFFGALREASVSRLVDVRLNNVSQLAGFAKRDDLRFFTETICGIPYLHEPRLAPTKAMLDEYKKLKGSWTEYEERFLGLMRERAVEATTEPELMDGACLLCSEEKPHHCHRRLVAEYLREKWGDVEICHLG